MKRYRINEVFHSLQGEGIRAGTANVFVRFTGCNLQCRQEADPRSPGGFDCDTEFASGRSVTGAELLAWINTVSNGQCPWLVLTGGEPGLQLDADLISCLHDAGHQLAIETNGSIALPEGLDWVTVSPKVAEHAIRQTTANEVKYVRGYGQAIPQTVVDAPHKLISPAFRGLASDAETIKWCSQLVMENPEWRLSVQMHKVWTLP